MPLADHLPKLDNRTFDDLVEEARARVPRYTNELTDFNPGDPAFALIELNAWMTDMLLYRLGRTSELHYLKFLELVGIELKPALPAATIVVIPVRLAFGGASVIVPARTAISAAEPDEKGPIVFETNRAFTAINARLAAVQVSDGYSTFDRTAANLDPAGSFSPFGDLANDGAFLLLGLDSNVALPGDAEMSLGIFTADTTLGGSTQSGTPAYRPGTIVFEAWSGLSWLPLTILGDETSGFTRTGTVRVRLPKASSMPRAAFEISDETPLRLDVAAGIAFPCGAIKASSLRREIARGRLEVELIAGKHFVTLAAISRLRAACRVAPQAHDSGSSQHMEPVPPYGSYATETPSRALDSARENVKKLKNSLVNTSQKSTPRRARSASGA